MIDQEKVIKWLECHTKKKVCMNHCPYCDGTGCTEMCTSKLIKDVLDLLKEQEETIKQMHVRNLYPNISIPQRKVNLE